MEQRSTTRKRVHTTIPKLERRDLQPRYCNTNRITKHSENDDVATTYKATSDHIYYSARPCQIQTSTTQLRQWKTTTKTSTSTTTPQEQTECKECATKEKHNKGKNKGKGDQYQYNSHKGKGGKNGYTPQ
eukprot:3264733-Amphidinium_carterae.12